MLLTLKQASKWASEHLNKSVTSANISYLIQYGRVETVQNSGKTLIPLHSLEDYYSKNKREQRWQDELGNDLNWTLSFEEFKEAETTKHVHRLHPYKGKFIPQLVEYFLDEHTDNFKKETYFKPGDIVLDPFCGSGTTLVQANELGINAVGIDISAFNAFISNNKVRSFNFMHLYEESQRITDELRKKVANSGILEFEHKITEALSEFNNNFFPFHLNGVSDQVK